MAAATTVERTPLLEAGGIREDRGGSWGGLRKCGSYRLPPYVVTALRGIFTGDYVELTSSWHFEVDAWAGAGDSRERVHLFDAERHCDRVFLERGAGGRKPIIMPKSPRTPSADVTRCREALLDLAEGDDDLALAVLRRHYGRPHPGARWAVWPEVADLVDFAPTILRLAEEREFARQGEAQRRFEDFWRAEERVRAMRAQDAAQLEEQAREGTLRSSRGTSAEVSWVRYVALWSKLLEERDRWDAPTAKREKTRALHLARVAGGAPLDTAAVVREQLDAHLTRHSKESKAAFAARRLQRSGERAAFVSTVRREADQVLAGASLKFREAWGGS